MENEEKPERRAVGNKFADACMVLAKHPKAEADWLDFLKQCLKYHDISIKQWKFFKVIHWKCLGHWPEWEDYEARDEAPKPVPTEEALDAF